jgi:hypothetical protein
MPSKVILEADEVGRTNRIALAKLYGKLPNEIDEMPYDDYLDTIAVMNADAKNAAHNRKMAAARRKQAPTRRRQGRRRR